MKIVSICVNGVYTDGFSYQENLLPIYQKKLGNEVTVLASEYEYLAGGVAQKAKTMEYIDENGLKIRRLAIKGDKPLGYKFKRFPTLYKALKEEAPDVIFCHLFQFLDCKTVIRYVKKHPECRLFMDSHADVNNSASSWLSKKILHGLIWKKIAKKSLPVVEKIYGVTPARVEFLKEIYKLPEEKIALLPMGADDDAVNAALLPKVCVEKRAEYGVQADDIVVMTGGKIDYNKPQTLLLMKAINQSENPRLKLLVFGSVAKEYEEEFNKQLSSKVRYVGWKTSEEIYKEFAAADLVAFPGLHSVLWEQAVGMGKPCLFRKIDGFNHVDLGGNCAFFKEDTTESYLKSIQAAVADLENMRKVALERGRKEFSYLEIAKRSIIWQEQGK